MMLLLGILFLSIIGSSLQCKCNDDTTVEPGVPYYLTNPTNDGTIAGSTCAASCTTRITMDGLINGQPAGASLAIQTISGFSATNNLTIKNGDNTIAVITTDNLPSTTILATQSNVIDFTFQLSTPVTIFILITPVAQQQITTTTVSGTTTTPYTTYSHNPGLNVVDLTLVFDSSVNNTQLQLSKDVATKFTADFNFDGNYGRLSIYQFDPESPIFIGAAPWKVTDAKLPQVLNAINQFNNGPPRVFEGLKDMFGQADSYPYRANTQRVLIYFTSQDSAASSIDVNVVNTEINNYNLKIIIVNMNSNKPFNGANFPNLSKLLSSGTNAIHSYNYINSINENSNVQNLMENVYFNGNQECNVQSSDAPGNIQAGTFVNLNIPADSSNNYCNYMNYLQTYDARVNPSRSLQVGFSQVDLNPNYDYVTVYADDKVVYQFTGNAFNTYICLNASITYGIGIKTQGDKVYSGFSSKLTMFGSYNDCKSTPPKYTTTTAEPSGGASFNVDSSGYRFIEI